MIYVKWAKKEGEYNFGDDLGPYIIENLTNKKINYIEFEGSRSYALLQFFAKLRHDFNFLRLIPQLIDSMFIKNYIVSIGSVIQWYSSKRAIIWGSGIINKNDTIKKSNFLAVRGKYTQEKILDLGLEVPSVIGDPALLSPLVFNPKVKKEYRLGIIPHIIHFEQVKEEYKSISDLLVINLNTSNIEKVITQILSCEKIVSSSLHGLIVPHSYGIESLWVNLSDVSLAGDNIKFFDYFSSVDIPEYKPFNIKTKFSDLEFLNNLFKNNASLFPDQELIYFTQKKLLSVAPFKVLEKFL